MQRRTSASLDLRVASSCVMHAERIVKCIFSSNGTFTESNCSPSPAAASAGASATASACSALRVRVYIAHSEGKAGGVARRTRAQNVRLKRASRTRAARARAL